jgi:hypothetical protein
MNLKEIRARKEVALQRLTDLNTAEEALLNTEKVAEDTAYFERMLRLLKTIKEAKDCRIAVRGDSGGWVNILPLNGEHGEELARIAQRMVLYRIANRDDDDNHIGIPGENLLPGVL